MVAVLVAYVVAACIKTEGGRYVTSAAYDAAPAATFLWVKTFPVGFYAPAVLPLIVRPQFLMLTTARAAHSRRFLDTR